ncbi:restriction endonuclease subunit S [Thermodesulfobacteriota bacterium]
MNEKKNGVNHPKSWTTAKLEEICSQIADIDHKMPKAVEQGVPFISAKDLTGDGKIVFDNVKQISLEDYLRLSRKIKPDRGDIIFSRIGTIGRASIVDVDFDFIASYSCCTIKPLEEINNRYLCFFLGSYSALKQATDGVVGIGVPDLGMKQIRNFIIPISPFNEQQRIVCKIDELLTRLDAGVESLKQVQTLLKRYRQSVLKSAVDGKLTQKWREQHKDELEHADKLLERILKKRREKWEVEQLANFKAKGKTPPKDWQKKYKEPKLPDLSNPPNLPKGWMWASGDQLTSKVVDGTHFTPKYTKKGVRFISVKDVRDDKIYFDNCKYISKEEHKRLIQRCYPQNGDVVITKSGTIGRTAVVDTEKDFSLFVSVALLKKSTQLLDSDFLKLIMDGYIQSINVQQKVKGGVIKNLHLEDIRIVPLRLAPLSEQKQIIIEVDRHFSIIAKLQNEIEKELKRSHSLRQSILKQAFEGKLVPQDPNDEPASVLLERIKAEKANLK